MRVLLIRDAVGCEGSCRNEVCGEVRKTAEVKGNGEGRAWLCKRISSPSARISFRRDRIDDRVASDGDIAVLGSIIMGSAFAVSEVDRTLFLFGLCSCC